MLFHDYANNGDYFTFDRAFEIIFSNFCKYIEKFVVVLPGNSESYSTTVYTGEVPNSSSLAPYSYQMSFRDFLDYIGDEFPTAFIGFTPSSAASSLDNYLFGFLENIYTFSSGDENLNDLPHYDTINDVFDDLNINELRKIQKYCKTT